jgi:hypothetical protein
MGYLNGELDDSLYILYVLKNLYGDYDKILGDLNIPSESIGLIEQSYRLGNSGTTLQALDAEYRRKLDNERAMLMAYFGYQISAALMNGTSVSPVFSEKSALDMLEKNGYLTSAQRSMVNWRWNGAEQEALNQLPQNVWDTMRKYEAHSWKGVLSGSTPGTRAGGGYDNENNLLPSKDTSGNAITYREFDVNNKLPGAGRDAERFVYGIEDFSVYYTDSHYGDIPSPTGLPPFVRLK